MAMHLLALAPDDFLITGKAWVEAVASVLEVLIAKLGILALAWLGLRQNVHNRLKAEIEEQSKRLDRQAVRINDVALAAQPAAPAEVTLSQPPGAPPIRVTEEEKTKP